MDIHGDRKRGIGPLSGAQSNFKLWMPQAVNRKRETLTFPLVHPSKLYRSARIERSIEAVHLGLNPPRRLYRIRSWIAKYRGLVKARMTKTAVERSRRGAR